MRDAKTLGDSEMSPTPRFDDVPSEIVATVKAVGEQLVDEHLDGNYTLPKDWRVLDGNCHENAYRLAEKLLQRGYTPYIVWGAVSATKGHNLRLDTIDQLERTTRVHFWVEIDPESIAGVDDPIVAELSSESIKHVNQPYVSYDWPPRYQTMADDPSYIRFERSFEVEDLISAQSYRQLREWRPYLFEHDPWADPVPVRQ